MNRIRGIALILSFLMEGIAAIAQEQPPQPVQEAFQSELVYPQEKGELQITTGMKFCSAKSASYSSIPLLMEYGFTERWQGSIQWDSFIRRNVEGAALQGAGDLSLGTQYSFMGIRGSHIHAAIGFELTLPSGRVEEGFGEGYIEYKPYFIGARDFPSLRSMHAYAGAGVGFVRRLRHAMTEGDGEPAAHELEWAAGVILPVSRAALIMEMSGSDNRWNAGKEQRMYSTPGAVWKLPWGIELGTGGSFGLTRDSDRVQLDWKLTREFGAEREKK